MGSSSWAERLRTEPGSVPPWRPEVVLYAVLARARWVGGRIGGGPGLRPLRRRIPAPAEAPLTTAAPTGQEGGQHSVDLGAHLGRRPSALPPVLGCAARRAYAWTC